MLAYAAVRELGNKLEKSEKCVVVGQSPFKQLFDFFFIDNFNF